jgi:hypothetical protein
MQTTEFLSSSYEQIPGWGMDADPKNEPTYPMKHYTGVDHQRLHYSRPSLQPLTMEVLHSLERPNISAVFGATIPPKGLSGAIRRMAYHNWSENQLRHWFTLILADRVNVVEGLVEDLAHGHIPNIFAERGWGAEWKYNRKSFITKLTIAAGAAVALAGIIYWQKERNNAQANE